jgi:hypothetical protein
MNARYRIAAGSIYRTRDARRAGASGGSTLTAATVAALDSSAALLVLCSTVSASRAAVNEEVRLFRSRHPDRPVIPVIIDGTPPDNFKLTPRSITHANCLLQKIRAFRDFRVRVQHFYTNGDSNDRRTFDAMLRRLRIDYNRSCPTRHPAGI